MMITEERTNEEILDDLKDEMNNAPLLTWISPPSRDVFDIKAKECRLEQPIEEFKSWYLYFYERYRPNNITYHSFKEDVRSSCGSFVYTSPIYMIYFTNFIEKRDYIINDEEKIFKFFGPRKEIDEIVFIFRTRTCDRVVIDYTSLLSYNPFPVKMYIPYGFKTGLCDRCKLPMFLLKSGLCHTCAADNHKRKVDRGYVYLIEDGDFIKIGKSKNFPDKRCKDLATKHHSEFKLIAYFISDECSKDEKRLHDKFHKFRERGEWFKIHKNTVLRESGIKFTTVLGQQIVIVKPSND